ncbi:ATP-binding protein [Halomonas dongshanensis]|uniref:histidine kinase n=1 Tax=Halomonas dongshanensis TaxID=2890835 RepID=A0ABT2EAG2_9GAMM|nr:ATP-binding protein [Halomonas dongshanensis]MCS2608564.1 HAMP domain-containing protein [Halomonas dongshanensis]
MRQGIRRCLPKTLYWRLVLILMVGMIAAQVLTSSVWYQVRHTEAMEIPLRVAAARLADLQRLANRNPELFQARIETFDRDGFHLSLGLPSDDFTGSDTTAQSLLKRAFAGQGGNPDAVTLRRATLITEDEEPIGWWGLASNAASEVRLEMTLVLDADRALNVDMQMGQGWSSRSIFDDAWDYLLRLYIVRIAVLMLLALVAVRLAVGPVNRLAEAAQRLGNDIRQPPLPDRGPIEVRRAAAAFNTMQQRLVKHLAQRTRFLAAISHDLRSPITRLRLRTEMLADETLKASFRRDLESMESMVAATLDTLQQQGLDEAFEKTDVASILRGIQADQAEQGRHIDLRGEVSRPLYAHPQSLQRAVNNLVENALRYGLSPGAETSVTIAVEQTPMLLCISVLDRGPGIEEEELGRVTEPFYRLEASRNRSTGGYGLGLSIVQTVAEAHHGTLILRNRKGGGLEARLELPYGDHA